MKLSNQIIILSAAIALTYLMASCAHQIPQPAQIHGVPGFWKGLLHGFIAPIAFFVSFFSDFRIYAYPNAGHWYDFGFMLGISGFSGGIFRASRKKNKC